MNPQDFEAICSLLQARSGIVLDRGKEYLVQARLAPILREHNFASISHLVEHLRRDRENGLSRKVVEALVTSESSFFRDHHPYEAMRQSVLPDLIERRRGERQLNIWCAACATGQEPYSVAMLLREHFPELATWRVQLLASDLSRPALERAQEGKFNQIEVNRGLPAALLVKYFQQHGTHWQLAADIRGMVTFRELNLSQAWPVLPRMDLVLIRNVMIYFGVPTKKDIFARLSGILRPDGYLLLGGAETTYQLSDAFRRVEPHRAGFYQMADHS